MKKLLAFLLLTGCSVGPKYHKPETEMPSQFVEKADLEEGSEEDLSRWWKQFQDPLLDSLVEEAIEGNYDLRVAVEQIVEARAQYKVQGSYLWPEIDLNAVANRSRYSQNIFTTASNATSFSDGKESGAVRGAMFGPPIQNFFQVGFDAVWELDFWGKIRHEKEAALDLWQASEFNAQYVLITAVCEVAKNYMAVRSLQQQIDWMERKIDIGQRQLFLAEALQEAGLDNQVQVDGFISSLEQERAQLPILEASLKTTLYSLAVLLGKTPESIGERFEEKGKVPQGLGKVPAGLPSDLLRRRPDIRKAERELAAATEGIGVAVAAFFPQIALTGNGYGYESNKTNNLFSFPSSYWSIGPSINWDLIDFGRTRNQVAVRNSLQRQALLVYEKTVLSSLQDVEGALVSYFEEQKRNLHLKEEKAAREEAMALSQDLFEAGLASELTELDAVNTWIESEISTVQSDQALASDLVALYKALGGEWGCLSTP